MARALNDAFVVGGYLHAVKHKHAIERAALAGRIGLPVDGDLTTRPGWLYVNIRDWTFPINAGEGAVYSADRRTAEALFEDWIRENLVTNDPNKAVEWAAKYGATSLRQISPGDYKTLFGQYRPANGFLHFLRTLRGMG